MNHFGGWLKWKEECLKENYTIILRNIVWNYGVRIDI